MASFNPDTGVSAVQAQDMTGASKGTGPNRAFEALFSGLGDTLEAGVQTADNYIKNTIEDDARYGFEALNQENNLTADTVPSELTQSSDGLQRLALAHQQGKVTQEYYYQRLASTAKGLRAKYPGYEKEVDDIIMNVTGTRPANAFRDALFANIESTNRALQSSQDNFDKWVLADNNIGVVQMAFPDYFEQPGKYSPEEVKAGVAKIKGQQETWTFQKSQMEGNKAFADQAINERMNQFTSSLLEGQSRALGMSGAQFMQKLNDYSAKGGMAPEEKAAFTNQYAQFLAAAQAAVIKETSDPVFQKLYSPQEMAERRTAALAPLQQIGELIKNDQYDAAAQTIARMTYQQNRAIESIIKADPNMLAVTAAAKISPSLGDWFLTESISATGNAGDYFEKVAVSDLMKAIVLGEDTLPEATQRIMDNKMSTSKDKNRQAGAIVTQFTTMLKSGKATPEELASVVKQNYTTGEKDVFSMVDSSVDEKGNSQYLRLYNEMFNPEITASVKKSADPDALRAYTDAAVDKFQMIPEFRKAAADLGENIDYGKFLRARYDEGSNRLILEADQGAISNLGYFTKTDNKHFVNRAVKAKDALNQALSVIAPIIEANGGNETDGIQEIIKNMAIDLEPQDRGGFFSWLNTQMDAILAGPDPAAQLKSGGGMVGDESKMGKAIRDRAAAAEAAKAPEGQWTPISSEDAPLENSAVDSSPLVFLTPQNVEATGDAAGMLNLLGRTEGTDKGRGYNETLGYGAYTGGDLDLTGMTLNEVDDIQSDMLKHPNNTWNSSAIGRYQIVRTTLRSLKKELGLTGDEIFSPQLQDQLAQALLERRGYSRWKAGEISTKAFLNNLAKEWASLPTAKGRGYYSGQRAAAKPSEVASALGIQTGPESAYVDPMVNAVNSK